MNEITRGGRVLSPERAQPRGCVTRSPHTAALRAAERTKGSHSASRLGSLRCHPEADFVTGRYEIPRTTVGGTVAVKIIDLLGEEVLSTHKP